MRRRWLQQEAASKIELQELESQKRLEQDKVEAERKGHGTGGAQGGTDRTGRSDLPRLGRKPSWNASSRQTARNEKRARSLFGQRRQADRQWKMSTAWKKNNLSRSVA